jgi:hypothetical protein
MAVAAASGCRALGNGNLARPDAVAVQPSATARDVADRINRNAQAIQAFRARTEVTVNHRRAGGTASGNMAFERPRSFCLRLKAPMHPDLADIGSNAQSFWFATSGEKTIYVGDYTESGAVPAGVPLTMQPDWIIEAMGLRELTDDEVAKMTVTRGSAPGTLVLSHRRQSGAGEPFLKEIVVNAENLQVIEHRLLTPDRKPLAVAVIKSYQSVPIGGGSEGRATLPRQVKLTWLREGLELDADIDKLEINPDLSDTRAAYFRLPEKPGYARVPLNGQNQPSYAAGPTRLRETRPAPPSGNPAHLDGLIPLGDDEALRAAGPAPLSADLPQLPNAPEGNASEGLVRPRVPSAPGAIDTTPSSGSNRRSFRFPGFER